MLACCNVAADKVMFPLQNVGNKLHLQCRIKMAEYQDAADSYKAQVARIPSH